jgi:hypothetical protein
MLGTAPAFALTQGMHEQIVRDSCAAHGMPVNFCERVGNEAYNVDHDEFNDLKAHGQMEEGQSACDGANAVLGRVHDLSREVNQEVWSDISNPTRANNEALAKSLGRLIHTAQDNCTHRGLTNPQHAWKSLSDVCDGTSVSPDVQPEAISCARSATDGILDAVLELLQDNGAEPIALGVVDSTADHWTSYGAASDYFASAKRWDGVDRRWDNTIVDPALRSEAYAAITSWDDPGQPKDVCAPANVELEVTYEDDVDVSDGPPDCAQITAFCVGKADSAVATEPPDEKASDDQTGVGGGGGCSVGGGTGGGAGLVVVLLGVLLSTRRGGGPRCPSGRRAPCRARRGSTPGSGTDRGSWA